MALDGKNRRKLRALGHHLEPVVIIGQQGVTEAVVGAVEQALYDHELIKVKVNEGPVDRHEAAAALAQGTGAEVAQVLGRTVLLFKQREEDSRFDLSKADARAKPKAARAPPKGTTARAPRKRQSPR